MPPTAVAADAAGNVYVTSEKWLAKYSPAGQLLAQRQSARYGAGVFYRITGLAVDAQGTPFVLDRGVQQCRAGTGKCAAASWVARRPHLRYPPPSPSDRGGPRTWEDTDLY